MNCYFCCALARRPYLCQIWSITLSISFSLCSLPAAACLFSSSRYHAAGGRFLWVNNIYRQVPRGNRHQVWAAGCKDVDVPPPWPFAMGTEHSARLLSHFVLVKPMQISSASKILLVPVPQLCSEPLPCRNQCTAHPGVSGFRGMNQWGTICLFGIFFVPELSEPAACRGRAGAYREGMGGPARTGWRLGFPVISAEFKIQEISHIWRELFLLHLALPHVGMQ